MEGLTIRPATAADARHIAEIIAGEPGQEATGICGSVSLARRFGMGFARLPGSPQGWPHSTVAEVDGRVAGVIQAGVGTNGFRVTPRIAFFVLQTFGPFRIPGLLRRFKARVRVQTNPPPGAYHVSELHVDPALRDRGIGGALLDWAEAQARAGGHSVMSLSTTTANPARRLYERHGFRVAETLTDPGYELITGIAGRHLMLKTLEQGGLR